MNRRGAVGLASLGTVLILVLGCGSSGSDSAGNRWAELDQRWGELGVEEAQFVFSDGVSPEERESMRRDLRVAQVVFAEQFGVVTSDFTVYTLSNGLYEERVVSVLGEEHYFELRCGFVAPDEPVIILPEACPDARPVGAFLAHEYFRILQREAGELLWRRQARESGVVTQTEWLDWLEGGAAVYASALVSDATGGIALDDQRAGARTAWGALAQPFPKTRGDLGDREQESLFLYQVGFLATDWLVERAGPEALLEFFRFGGHEAAFEAAFGLTLDEFHSAFEQHRLDVAPSSE